MVMQKIEVSREAKGDKPGFSIAVDYNMPADLAEAVKTLSAEMVYKVFLKQATVIVQGVSRRLYGSGLTLEKVNEALKTYKLEAKDRGPRKPRTEADVVKVASGLTPVQMQAAIAEMQKMLAAKKA